MHQFLNRFWKQFAQMGFSQSLIGSRAILVLIIQIGQSVHSLCRTMAKDTLKDKQKGKDDRR